MSKYCTVFKHMNEPLLKIKGFFQSKYFYFGIIILTIGAGALFLFGPMLFGKLLFPQTSAGFYHYMYFTVMKYFVYNLHTLPNWWPGYDSGYPINLTLDAFLNPIFILALKFLPAFTANNIMVFFFFVLNGLSLYAFARALKLTRVASLISALSYAFSGVIMKYTPITGITALMPFLPLSFLCCLKIMQNKTKWIWIWLLLLVYSWIGGWSEMIVYALIAVGFFAIYLGMKEKIVGSFGYQRLILFFSAIIASILILLPWFLSILYFISSSNRNGGVMARTSDSMPTTISHLVHMIYPRLSIFYGELLPFFSFSTNDYFLYIGALPLFLVFVSFFIKNKKEEGHLIFFLSLAVGSVLMTINHSPLFWLLHQMPVLQWFRGYWKWSFVIVFSLAILAGYGADHIKDFFKHRFSKYALIISWAVIIVSLLGAGAIALFDNQIQSSIASYGISHYQNTPNRVFGRSDNYYQGIIETMSQSLVNAFSLKNTWVQFTIILWLIVLIHITLGKYEILSWQKWRLSAILITFIGSVFMWTGFYGNTPVSYLKTEPATAAYLHSINPYRSNALPLIAEKLSFEPYRIFLYTPDQFIAELSEKYKVNVASNEIRALFDREMMDGNTHIAFNFDTFFNHQTLASQRLVDTYYLSKQQKRFTQESYADATIFNEYVKAFSKEKNMRLLGALNIKYILTPFSLENEQEPIFTTYITDNKLPIHVFENPYFMPRWYFAKNIKWVETENAWEEFQKISDFHQMTLLEKITSNDPALITKPDSQDTLALQLYTAGKLQIKTKTKNYRFLIFSENKQPFWQVTINNRPTPLYTANYLYQAVLVPPGENVVEFHYPNLWEQGLISAQSYLQSFIQKLLP